jgi:aquaporin NIP
MSPETRPRRCLAEAVGAFFLVFAGTGAVVVNELSRGALGVLGVALVFGLIVTAMIYAIGRVSGAHMNPAISLAFCATGRLPHADLLPYVAAQLAGATAASGVLRMIFWGGVTNLGVTQPAGPALQSLFLELVMTALLMFVIMGTATDDKAESAMAGIAIGAVVALEAAFGGPVSGASMNPARSFGPAFVTGTFGGHWIYWLGPLAGAPLGAWLYERLR